MEDANWCYIENTKEDAKSLLEMFWEFHDFRVIGIYYGAEKNCVDVMLEYDSDGLRVVLKFIDVMDMNFVMAEDFEISWLEGTSLFADENGCIVWVCDEIEENEKLPENVLWLKSKKLNYAVVNEKNEPIIIPDNITEQECRSYNFNTNKYDVERRLYSPKYLI